MQSQVFVYAAAAFFLFALVVCLVTDRLHRQEQLVLPRQAGARGAPGNAVVNCQ